MPEVSDAVIFLADLNDARPWWRERVPGLRQLEADNKIVLLDIFEAIGFPELSSLKLYLRREVLSRHDVQEKILENLMALTVVHKSKRVLFSTLDNCLTFLTEDLVFSLKEQNIVLGCIFGDDELNYENYKFFLRLFDFVVVIWTNMQRSISACVRQIFCARQLLFEANRIAPSEQENKIALLVHRLKNG